MGPCFFYLFHTIKENTHAEKNNGIVKRKIPNFAKSIMTSLQKKPQGGGDQSNRVNNLRRHFYPLAVD